MDSKGRERISGDLSYLGRHHESTQNDPPPVLWHKADVGSLHDALNVRLRKRQTSAYLTISAKEW
tara:strand:+ start:508 stop:702 length:195 start_codon:yes stop_codon:yes gene_type:complete